MTTDAQFWDNIAESYAKKPVANPSAWERKLAINKAKLAPKDIILDIGCGTGSLALELAPRVAHVHSIDVSSEMLRIARGKAAAQNATNISFHNTTFDRFAGFEPGSLDGVCAYSILHLVEDPVEALNKIYRLLKPGGFFVSSTVCLADSWVPYGPIISVMRWFGKAPEVRFLRAKTWLSDIRNAGFVEVSIPETGAAKTTMFVVASKPL